MHEEDRIGGIYLFGSDLAGPVKIGHTLDIKQRMARLTAQRMPGNYAWHLFHLEMVEFQGEPHAYRYFSKFPRRKIRSIEHQMHLALGEWRLNGEWFDLPVQELKECLSWWLPPAFEDWHAPVGEVPDHIEEPDEDLKERIKIALCARTDEMMAAVREAEKEAIAVGRIQREMR